MKSGSWQSKPLYGIPPAPRQLFPSTLLDDFFYIFPGFAPKMTFMVLDCFRVSLLSFIWQQISCPGINKVYHASTSVGPYLAMFYGVNATVSSNELILAKLGEITNVTVASPTILFPSPRFGHTLMRVRSYLWLFGGQNENT